MDHRDPQEDVVILRCKGYCGSYVVLPLERLLFTMRHCGQRSIADFSRSFRCSDCEAQVDFMIETAAVTPLFLNKPA